MIAKHSFLDPPNPVNVHAAVVQLGSDRWTKLILKLRWIGEDEEAGRLERALRNLGPEQSGSVSAEPDGTD